MTYNNFIDEIEDQAEKKVLIGGTKFGEITINEKPYDSDVYVWWDGEVEMKTKRHVFDANDIVHLLRKGAESIVIGSGQQGVVKIAEEIFTIAKNKGVKVFFDTTPKAVEIFNGLVLQNKKPGAFFHVTC